MAVIGFYNLGTERSSQLYKPKNQKITPGHNNAEPGGMKGVLSFIRQFGLVWRAKSAASWGPGRWRTSSEGGVELRSTNRMTFKWFAVVTF